MGQKMRLLATIAVILFCLQSFSNNKADVDLWGNVGFVKAMPWSQEFLRTNTFSFTEPGHAWINHEWLSEYILNRTHTIAGNSGLLALKVALGLLAIGLLSIAVRRGAASGTLQFLFLILVISTMGYGFSIRPHLFTYVFLILFLLILKYHWKNRSLVLLVVPAMGLVWANLHGAFFVGIVLVILFTVSELFKSLAAGRIKDDSPFLLQLLAALALLGSASFATPYGLDLWKFIAESAATARPYLSEWEPFNPVRHFADHTDFMALTILSAASLAFSSRRKDPTWICLLALSFIGALILRRNIPIFAIVTCFVVPEHMEDVAGNALARIRESLPAPVLPVLLCAFIPLCAWYTVAVNKTNPLQIEVPRDRFPTGVMSFIKANNIRGNMLTFFDWAEYCIWKLYPDCRVFLDGRFTDAYGRETVSDYLTILYSGKDWETILKKYPVNMLLLHKENSTYIMLSQYNDRPSYKKILGMDNWRLICEDQVSGLFLNTAVHSNFLNSLQVSLPVNVTERQDAIFP